MRARIDQEQTGERRVKGVEMQIIGRIKGANRASRKVIKQGRQDQQDRQSQITEGRGTIQTKFGTIGIRVQCALEAVRQAP